MSAGWDRHSRDPQQIDVRLFSHREPGLPRRRRPQPRTRFVLTVDPLRWTFARALRRLADTIGGFS